MKVKITKKEFTEMIRVMNKVNDTPLRDLDLSELYNGKLTKKALQDISLIGFSNLNIITPYVMEKYGLTVKN